MKHYLLLRDNKQTGPHTFEDLLAMGLRAHDLIWVDGKSAAWRYPAEFPEFKEHAPAAPEQPFDRFFRKPASGQSALPAEPIQIIGTDTPLTPMLSGQDPDADAEVPTLTRFMQEQEADKQKEKERIRIDLAEDREEDKTAGDGKGDILDDQPRYVSVSLPAQDAERPIVVIGTTDRSEAEKADAGTTDRFLIRKDEPMSVAPGKPVAALFPERDPLATTRKPAPRSGIPWLQYAAILVGILSFMGLGILIGIKWTRGKMASTENQGPTTLQTNNSSTGEGGPDDQGATVVLSDSSLTAKSLLPQTRINRKLKKDSNGAGPLLSGELVHADVTKEMDPAVLQAETRKRREAEEKERVKGNITQVVNIQAGKYKVGVFGGISDLDVTVINGSGYPMDQVVVEVDYLLSSKKVFKTETLRFGDLGPHESKTLTLPRTNRGVKTESRIVRIDCHELDLSWSRN